MFPLELVMDFLRSQGSAMDSVSCVSICPWASDSAKDWAKLSFVLAKRQAMEWASLCLTSASDACELESALARAGKLF